MGRANHQSNDGPRTPAGARAVAQHDAQKRDPEHKKQFIDRALNMAPAGRVSEATKTFARALTPKPSAREVLRKIDKVLSPEERDIAGDVSKIAKKGGYDWNGALHKYIEDVKGYKDDITGAMTPDAKGLVEIAKSLGKKVKGGK